MGRAQMRFLQHLSVKQRMARVLKRSIQQVMQQVRALP